MFICLKKRRNYVELASLTFFQNGGSSGRHFENRRGEGAGDEVWVLACIVA